MVHTINNDILYCYLLKKKSKSKLYNISVNIVIKYFLNYNRKQSKETGNSGQPLKMYSLMVFL